MALIVQKFGSPSLGSVDDIRRVARRVARWKAMGHDIVVVPSAMAGEAERLSELARAVMPDPDPRELDVIAATGEQVTIALLAMALIQEGVRARSYTGAQVRVLTDSAFTRARILQVDDERLRHDLAGGHVVVVAGFQGVDEAGNITTLGRGGSERSAVALAAALGADECQIHAEADGVHTADPAIVPEARRLARLSIEEMLELASLGARIPGRRSVELAGKYRVRLRVLSAAHDEDAGTLITPEEDITMEHPIISGIACSRDEAKLTLLGVPDRPGIAYQILGPVADANIDVDMIIQNVGHDGSTDFSFTVRRSEYNKTLAVLEGVRQHTGARAVAGDNRIGKVSAVGLGMRSHPGVASRMFRALAEEGINIQMISTSEIRISVVIDEKYLELAVRALHEAFGLAATPAAQRV